MDYEDFKIGDRVGKFYDNVIEKATIMDIQQGLYLLKFDNNEYENLLCDNEKIFKIDKEKSLLDKIINTDFLEDMCSEETANEYKKLIKEEIEKIKQKAFEDGQTSIIKRYISKDKIREKIDSLELQCQLCNIRNLIKCDTQCTIGCTKNCLKELLEESE